jgi:hypothetical protein
MVGAVNLPRLAWVRRCWAQFAVVGLILPLLAAFSWAPTRRLRLSSWMDDIVAMCRRCVVYDGVSSGVGGLTCGVVVGRTRGS